MGAAGLVIPLFGGGKTSSSSSSSGSEKACGEEHNQSQRIMAFLHLPIRTSIKIVSDTVL